jgi:hypothetical protein
MNEQTLLFRKGTMAHLPLTGGSVPFECDDCNHNPDVTQ